MFVPVVYLYLNCGVTKRTINRIIRAVCVLRWNLYVRFMHHLRISNLEVLQIALLAEVEYFI
jgi:hypothetical protein